METTPQTEAKPKKPKRNNSNESLVRRLETLKESGRQIRIVHGRIQATGQIDVIHVGRYRVHIEVAGTLFPVDYSVMKILPAAEEVQNPPPAPLTIATATFKSQLRKAAGILDTEEL